MPTDQLETLRARVADLERQLALVTASANYECCCTGAGCDCFTKRDAAWRTIPGNYPCPKCCNDDCDGTGPCPPECCCGEGLNCAAFQAVVAAERAKTGKGTEA